MPYIIRINKDFYLNVVATMELRTPRGRLNNIEKRRRKNNLQRQRRANIRRCLRFNEEEEVDFLLSKCYSINVVDENLPVYKARANNLSEPRMILPGRNSRCKSCNSLMWLDERISSSSKRNPLYTLCCQNGKVRLPTLNPAPPLLERLLTGQDDLSVEYKTNIRSYNNAFAFTSFGANIDRSLLGTRGVYTFKVHGQVCHLMGSLLPPDLESSPKFLQLYIHDTDNEIQNRAGYNSNLNLHLLTELQNMIDIVNPFAVAFKKANLFLTNDYQQFKLTVKDTSDKHDRRTYSQPKTSEVAIVYCEPSGCNNGRDIILRKQDDSLVRIHETDPSYIPLHYVLLFPSGDPGWSIEWQQAGVTQKSYYSYRLMERNEFSILHMSGRLFQQYIVDVYASTDQNRANYLRFNQSKIRSELYQGLQDAVNAEDEIPNAGNVGRRTILPSSYIGSPRNMIQLYQDAMAIVRKYGKPDLFITFTCNPAWQEILDELKYDQTAQDRPDLVARVFHLKLECFLKDITKNDIFGKVIAYTYVIEFQKRGLPHCHMLLILEDSCKLRNVDHYNQCVKAEFPDQSQFPEAFETVSKMMIHGPCGVLNPRAPCMKNGKCEKKYPKTFCEETTMNADGYPIYKRANNGVSIVIRNQVVDNRWVVPYNLYLVTKYNAHINVEVCSTITAVKYLYKYVYKGSDRATLEISRQDNDEISQYLDGRYISASEACWRLFGFKLHKRNPSIVRLQVHLPGMQMVSFSEDAQLLDVLETENNVRTTLTEWFVANQTYEHAKNILYQDFPENFTWDESARKWTPRKSGFSIGRMNFVNINAGERFYLRLLLNNIMGAVSFENLRTVNGFCYATFKEACIALGLLEDDSDCIGALTEASGFQSASSMRQLFATVLLFCEPANSFQLWEMFKNQLFEDYFYHSDGMEPSNVYNMALADIQRILTNNGKSLDDYPGFSTIPNFNPDAAFDDAEINFVEVNQLNLDYEANMNLEQREIYNEIVGCVVNENENQKNVFFIDGPGGTGKTYLYDAIISKMNLLGKKIVAVASSGIASLLLPNGQTAHSFFKIPVNIDETSMCNISKQSKKAKELAGLNLIIWDEAPMTHRYCFECLSRSLQDIKNSSKPFGGVIVLFGGDFRQILPVVLKGSKSDTIDACLKRSDIWINVECRKLYRNMRVNVSETSEEFVKWLLKVGDGKNQNDQLSNSTDSFDIPRDLFIAPYTIEALLNFVYPDIVHSYMEMDYFQSKCVLAPKNEDVDKINRCLLNKLPGESASFLSIDRIVDDSSNNQALYPQEFLNNLSFNGLPLHKLELKIGVPVILLRNLDPRNGLCNGTKLIIKGFTQRILEAVIVSGKFYGRTVFIPRINLSPSSNELPFTLIRKQFPVRLAFGMTINKAQGQTLDYVGLYFPSSVFSHGQLYVACSRVKSRDGLKIFVEPGVVMNNIVYHEVL